MSLSQIERQKLRMRHIASHVSTETDTDLEFLELSTSSHSNVCQNRFLVCLKMV